MDAVATCCLGLIEGVICLHGGLVEAIVVRIAARNAATYRKSELAARAAHGDLVDRLADSLGDQMGAGRRCVRQQQAKLVTASPCKNVLIPQLLANRP